MINEQEFLQGMEAFLLESEMEELNVKLAQDAEDGENLVVQDKNSAEFYLKQLKKCRQEKAEINEFVDNEIKKMKERYEEYRRSCLKPLESSEAFYESGLMTFMLNEKENGKKSIKLPSGTLSIKKQQPKYIYDDEKILEFLQSSDLNHLIRVKETKEIDKKELKKEGQIIGETLKIKDTVVPGVEVIAQADKFEVK